MNQPYIFESVIRENNLSEFEITRFNCFKMLITFRSLIVHGFTMDEHGRKMSKSVGNVVDPETVIKGGKVKLDNILTVLSF